MPNTYTQLFTHIVFSTKERRKLLTPQIRAELYPYMSGIAQGKNFTIVSVNGIDDHVHAILLLPTNISVSEAVQSIKGNSSKWINDKFFTHRIFSWQEGYGAFSVSSSQVEIVKHYIENQEEHHKNIDFKTEYRQLLEKHGITFEEKYLF
ncbi:MAG: IS200/IS605 family transposase [Candidatus Magasanikbacteria bacterium]|nr:IS200/IS605 family transposase [Candidatus Magasanikbacteria bacterium]